MCYILCFSSSVHGVSSGPPLLSTYPIFRASSLSLRPTNLRFLQYTLGLVNFSLLLGVYESVIFFSIFPVYLSSDEQFHIVLACASTVSTT